MGSEEGKTTGAKCFLRNLKPIFFDLGGGGVYYVRIRVWGWLNHPQLTGENGGSRLADKGEVARMDPGFCPSLPMTPGVIIIIAHMYSISRQYAKYLSHINTFNAFTVH